MTQVTAVILTYNRQDVLRRQLLYYANKPIHIIFADGSESDWGGGSSGSIGAMTWEYFSIGGMASYFARMYEASRRTQTDFVTLLDDEECILWTGIQESITFLKQNSEYSSAGGRVDTTTLTRRRLSLVPHYGDKNLFDLVDDDPLSRFAKLFNTRRTRSFYYRLMRTSDFKIFGEVVREFDTSEKYTPLAEFLLLGTLTLFGRQKPCAYPFHIRNGGSQPAHAVLNRVPLLQEDINDSCKVFREACRLRSSRTKFNVALSLDSTLEILMSGIIDEINNRNKDSGVCENSSGYLSQIRTTVRKQKAALINYSGSICFDYFPALYYLFGNTARKTFARAAEVYAPGDQAVLSDFRLIEEIWTKFPNGLTGSQFEEELALLGKSGLQR